MRGQTEYTDKVKQRENAMMVLAEVKQRIAEIKKRKKTKKYNNGTNIVECSENYIKEYDERFSGKENLTLNHTSLRNRQICRMFENGKTLEEIKVEMDLSIKISTLKHIVANKEKWS